MERRACTATLQRCGWWRIRCLLPPAIMFRNVSCLPSLALAQPHSAILMSLCSCYCAEIIIFHDTVTAGRAGYFLIAYEHVRSQDRSQTFTVKRNILVRVNSNFSNLWRSPYLRNRHLQYSVPNQLPPLSAAATETNHDGSQPARARSCCSRTAIACCGRHIGPKTSLQN